MYSTALPGYIPLICTRRCHYIFDFNHCSWYLLYFSVFVFMLKTKIRSIYVQYKMWTVSVAHKQTHFFHLCCRRCSSAPGLQGRRSRREAAVTNLLWSFLRRQKKKRPTKERREDQISKVNPPENEDVTTIQQLQLDKCLANKDLYSKPCSLLSNNIVLRS